MSGSLNRPITRTEKKQFSEKIDQLVPVLTDAFSDLETSDRNPNYFYEGNFRIDGKLLHVIKSGGGDPESRPDDEPEEITTWQVKVRADEEADIILREEYELWQYDDDEPQEEYRQSWWQQNEDGRLVYIPTPHETKAIDQLNEGLFITPDSVADALAKAITEQQRVKKSMEHQTGIETGFTKLRHIEIMGYLGRLSDDHLID